MCLFLLECVLVRVSVSVCVFVFVRVRGSVCLYVCGGGCRERVCTRVCLVADNVCAARLTRAARLTINLIRINLLVAG